MRKSFRTPLLVVVAFLGGALFTRVTARADSRSQSPYLPFDEMGSVMGAIDSTYVDVPSQQKLVEGAIKGMVNELDPHSAYMNPEEYSAFRGDNEGNFGGVGVEVDTKDETVTVIAPIEGSPAARAGILSGDKIVSVDAKLIRGTRIDKLVEEMRGKPGTHVRLGIVRGDKPEIIYFDLVREVVHVASVEGKRLKGDILYLRVKQFQEETHKEMLDAIGKVRADSKADFRGVILDLRYNPGGLVDQAEGVADELLDDGIIYSTRHRGEIVDEVKATHGGALTEPPLVVLVNEYSASAAELVAGCLQDSKRGLIVGQRTFGKGSVQTIFDLPNGAGMRLTTMRYYTPSGHSIQAAGISPDVVIHRKGSKGDEVVRESDLDGHLVNETEPVKPETPAIVVEGPEEAPEPPRTAEIPPDPTSGKDFVLAEGFRRLTAKIK